MRLWPTSGPSYYRTERQLSDELAAVPAARFVGAATDGFGRLPKLEKNFIRKLLRVFIALRHAVKRKLSQESKSTALAPTHHDSWPHLRGVRRWTAIFSRFNLAIGLLMLFGRPYGQAGERPPGLRVFVR